MKITRRALAKRLAALGAGAGLEGLLHAEADSASGSFSSIGWRNIHPGVWRASFGVPESFTPVQKRLVPVKKEAFAKLPEVEAVPLPPITGRCTARGCMIQSPLQPGEHVFGLGLQFLSFDQRGKKKIMRVNADPKADTGDSHAPVPFYVTTEGIGVLIDTARYATFYFGDARPKPALAAHSISDANPDPNYTHNFVENDAGTIIVDIPEAEGVDVYLFAGPRMLDAVKRYNVFSGGGCLPPEWGLGFWYRMDSRGTQQSTLALACEFRDRKIPCDVMGLEAGWQTHAYPCTFAWNQERFPDPSNLIRSAQEMNYKINLWEHAFTHPASRLYSAIEPDAGDFGVWGGLVPDFAGDAARADFGNYHGENFIDKGVSGFKLDECDNSDFTGGWSFPECSSFPSGVDGEQMHSLFGIRYQSAIWEAFRKRSQPTYSLVRSSGALAAPYPFVLYSDLYNHRDFIRALVNSGFSGLLWCPEVRDAVSEEDLICRLQSVAFSPLAMVNGWYIKNPPWKQLDRQLNNADQLSGGWEALESRCREIIGWRMQLVPYLTAAFQRYTEDGTPPFRALVLDTPEDERLYSVDDQYMIGDRMMVAPMFCDRSEDSASSKALHKNQDGGRKVVLPQGAWHDFWSGALFKGGTEIFIPSSADKIPVFVKSGSIVPWADCGLYAGAPETRQLTARIYGDGSIPFSLVNGKSTLRLTWSGGRGSATGESDYMVYAWKQMRSLCDMRAGSCAGATSANR